MFCKSYPIPFLLICLPAGRKAFKFNVGITELYLNVVLIELRHGSLSGLESWEFLQTLEKVLIRSTGIFDCLFSYII